MSAAVPGDGAGPLPASRRGGQVCEAFDGSVTVLHDAGIEGGTVPVETEPDRFIRQRDDVR